jgi:hypothetical protein
VSKASSLLTRVVAALGPASARLEARLGRRGLLAAGGGAAVVAVLFLFLIFKGGPTAVPTAGPGQSSSPGESGAVAAVTPTPTQEPVYDLLPTPSTIDIVLLVASKDALTSAEQQWLSDLRASLGNVDPLPYHDATLEALRQYLVVFVIDQSPDLDPAVLAQAYDAGLTVHLIGNAASYAATVQAGASP